jgi:hypothetical protein
MKDLADEGYLIAPTENVKVSAPASFTAARG